MPYLLIDRHGYHETVDLPQENLLKSLYSELRCSLIEIAPTLYRGYVLIIDEEGNIEKIMHKVKPDTNAADILAYLAGE